jgi:hypothetical protein
MRPDLYRSGQLLQVVSCRYDAIVLHANIQALRGIKIPLTFSTGLFINLEQTLIRGNGVGRAYRLAISTGGAQIHNDFQSHNNSPAEINPV